MNIKTITCHDVYNYGASLQAYALQEYLTKLGHNVEIIDYKPEYLQRTYNFWYIPLNAKYYKLTQKSKLMHLFFAVMRLKKTYATRGRIKPFKLFKKKYLHLTTTYYNYKQLYSTPPKASVYIAGSDQIWNTKLPNGKDPAFYLGFGDSKVKKISYAASFGITEIEPSESIKNYLQNFDAISVREKTGLDILKRIGIKNAVHVVDPVFLLTAPQWSNLTKTASQIKIPNYNYILLYDFVNDHKIGSFVKMCAKQTGMQILSVNDYRSIPYADQNINNAGPWEFISLIEHANIVISNSFHATAFSCIFNKEFYTFPLNTQQNSSRMTDLLSCAKMPERFNPQKRWTSNIFGTQFMETSIETSKYFLDHHLNINFIL